MLFGLDFWKMFFIKKIQMDQIGFMHLENSTDFNFLPLEIFQFWPRDYDHVISDVDEVIEKWAWG